MSKSRTTSERPKASAAKKLTIFDHLAAASAARASKLASKRGLLSLALFALCIIGLCVAWHAGAVSTAMLYLIADNGKKSGRASGNVYMRNGRIRGFVVPALVQNTYTQTQRVQLGLLSAGWSALTPAEQLSWNNLSGLFRSNRFGIPVEIKGKAAYVLCNMNLFNVGAAPITTAPVLVEVASITDATLTATAAGGIISIAYTPTPTSPDMDHLVFATSPQRAGIYRPSESKYRLIGVLANTSASPQLFTTEYSAKFGAFAAGQKIFIKLVGINNNTGQAAPALVISDIAA